MDGFLKCFVILLFPTLIESITTDYLNQVCDVSSKSLETSLRLESSTALAYSYNTDCFYNVVTTDSSKFVFLLIRHFTLESEVNGACVDYVNIHDGSDVTAPTLNASPLCGTYRTEQFFSSTGNHMTIFFHSDSRGQYQGFEMTFSAATTGTCSSSQTTCVNASVCIESSVKCNTVDECGDNTDEDGCVYPGASGVRLHPRYILIISLIVGAIVLLTIVIAAGAVLWRTQKWRWFMRKPISADRLELQSTTYETAYPVTKVYYKDRFQSMFTDLEPTEHSEIHNYQITQLDIANGTQSRTSYQTLG